ncbi:MAG: hypothetical protein ACTIJ6_00005 [Leucobacter sp.]
MLYGGPQRYAYISGAESVSKRRTRAPKRLLSAFLLAAALVVSSVAFSGTAPARAEGLPEGVTPAGQALFWVDEAGAVFKSGPVSPGKTFFAGSRFQNASEAPITVTGFESNFVFTMHPDRQGDFPLDHCMQFFETRSFDDRERQQTYPIVIEPGETATLYDNMTYHYIYGPPSNECQQGSVSFGHPLFGSEEPIEPPANGVDIPADAPTSGVQAPTPPVKIDTGK